MSRNLSIVLEAPIPKRSFRDKTCSYIMNTYIYIYIFRQAATLAQDGLAGDTHRLQAYRKYSQKRRIHDHRVKLMPWIGAYVVDLIGAAICRG